jgi:putative endonuclease
MNENKYWVYILRCSNGSYYTGYTTDMMRRYEEHVRGTTKCKYTRSFKPVNIAQSWIVKNDKSIAMKIEKFIKKLRKKEKEQLILHPEKLIDLFLCELSNEKQ